MSRAPWLLALAGCAADPTGSTPTVTDGAAFREIVVFQAVAVPLLLPDGPVADDARNAPLIAGRGAVVRVRPELPADWTPTELTLTVDLTSGGTTRSFETRALTAGDPDPADPTSGLIVELPADAMTPDATWSARLTADGALHARFPETGAADVGAVPTGPLDVRFVPFEVNGFVPDTSDAVIEGFRAALLATYPVTDVTVSVAPVEVWSSEFDLGDVNVRVGELQEAAMFAGEVPWTTYYYGLVTGVASRDAFEGPTGTSESGGDELVRAYFATGAAFGDQRSEDTLIHELGHVHGLLHTPCDGEPDVDPDYPYADGTIGVEGHDARTGAFVPADTMDLMAYCYPRWISDYNFARVAAHVAAAQDYEGPP